MCDNMCKCNATCFGIFLRRKMMFVHKSNPNYLEKCVTHVKCMYLNPSPTYAIFGCELIRTGIRCASQITVASSY